MQFGYFFVIYVVVSKFIPNDSRKKVLNDFYGVIINKGKDYRTVCSDKLRLIGDILEQN
jgi:hypothetical protein